MKRLLILACMGVLCTTGFAFADSSGSSSYADKAMEMIKDNPVQEKVIIVNEKSGTVYADKQKTTLLKELGVSEKTEEAMLDSSKKMDSVMEKYGYEKDKSGKYETSFETARLIVKGDMPKNTYDCKDSIVKDKNFVVLQYDTPEAAAIAYAGLKSDGEKVFKDEIIDTNLEFHANSTEHVSYAAELMNLDRLAEDGTHDVTVAVLDSGIDTNNSNFKGRISDVGMSFINSETIEDVVGHGTQVASVVLDNTPNRVQVLPLKVVDHSGNTSILTVDAAINYASDRSDVINVSVLMKVTNDLGHSFWNESIENAIRKGCPVVVAAGNESDSTVNYYPACNHDCWTIGAIDRYKNWANFSNHGDIDFVAPGVDINVTNIYDRYESVNGTSYAAPVIAAVAAIEKSNDPDMIVDEIYNRIKGYCQDLGEKGYDRYYGYGLPVCKLSPYVPTNPNNPYKPGDSGNVSGGTNSGSGNIVKQCDHKWQDTRRIESTCTVEGARFQECMRCFEDRVVSLSKDMTNHVNKGVEHKDATCTKTGYDKEYCKDCKMVLSTTIIPMKEHQYYVQTKKPTYTSAGYKRTICKGCGDVKSITNLAKLQRPSKVTGLKISKIGVNSAKLTWNMNKTYSKYEVKRYYGGKLQKTAYVNSTQFIDKGLRSATGYHYSVRCYVVSEGTRIYSNTASVGTCTKPEQVKVKKLVRTSDTTAKVYWNKQARVDGYRVAYSSNKDSFKGVNVSGTSKSLKFKGRDCYVKVRAYRVVNGKVVYGDYSVLWGVRLR